jgi:mannose-6-phosphate isomerase-like protein (cupin superfamily)
MLEHVKHQNDVLAIILRKGFDKEGANFFTASDDSFQFGVIQYKKDMDIRPHKHIKAKRQIDTVCEVLFVQKGRIEVNFYDDKNRKIESRILNAGDTILMKEFGHGFRLLEDSKLIEVKQGPYLGKDSDKEYLNL